MKVTNLLILAFCSGLLCFAQTISKLQFEVASVRRSATADTRAGAQSDGPRRNRAGVMSETSNRISYQRVTFKAMLMKAYKLQAYQISGPVWIDNEHYDVTATIPETGSREKIPEMLQNLLADRFGLSLHSEIKEQPVYILSVGKGGPKLKPSSSNPSRAMGGYTIDQAGQAQMKFLGETMAEFASLLSLQLDRPVVDATGLSGNFDITIPVDARDLQAGADPVESSLITAVHGIGLNLGSGKAPITHLIVDKALKIPIEN